MWLDSTILEGVNELLFFANTPNYIVEGLRKKNVIGILKLRHTDKSEIVKEIDKYMCMLQEDTIAYAYLFVLIVYLGTSFSGPSLEDIHYNSFPFLREVIKLFNAGPKEIVYNIPISIEKPEIVILNC